MSLDSTNAKLVRDAMFAFRWKTRVIDHEVDILIKRGASS